MADFAGGISYDVDNCNEWLEVVENAQEKGEMGVFDKEIREKMVFSGNPEQFHKKAPPVI